MGTSSGKYLLASKGFNNAKAVISTVLNNLLQLEVYSNRKG